MSTDNQSSDPLHDDVAAAVGAAVEGEHIAAADTPAEPSADDQSEAALVFGVLRLVSNKVAPAWGIADDELIPIAHALPPCLRKWFPDFKLGPEGVLAAAVGAVVLPRMGMPLKDEPPQNETDNAPSPAS